MIKDYSNYSLNELGALVITCLPNNTSYLTSRIYQLQHLKLKDLVVEDIRILIKQRIGLSYIIPLAIDILKKEPMVEGDFYEGDLLISVLEIEPVFWQLNQQLAKSLREILVENQIAIQEFDTTETIKGELEKALAKFLKQ